MSSGPLAYDQESFVQTSKCLSFYLYIYIYMDVELKWKYATNVPNSFIKLFKEKNLSKFELWRFGWEWLYIQIKRFNIVRSIDSLKVYLLPANVADLLLTLKKRFTVYWRSETII
jgi:hypothetical protein